MDRGSHPLGQSDSLNEPSNFEKVPKFIGMKFKIQAITT
jgi:hypothetical protein